jgi:hypothetical protein
MTMTLDISDDLKPAEAAELVELAKEQDKPIGIVLLEAARKLAAQRRAGREMAQPSGQFLAA